MMVGFRTPAFACTVWLVVALSPAPCRECEQLLAELEAEHHMLAEIHRLQADAALKNDAEGFEQLQPHLMRLRKRRDAAAEALSRHMRKHGR